MGKMNNRIILAADLRTPCEAEPLLDQLGEHLVHVKIGPRLFASGGMAFVDRVIGMGFKVFLDLKLHDIPNTISSAVDFFASKGIWAITLHSSGGLSMLEAAASVNRTKGGEMMLLGVTVLTSLDSKGWNEVNPGCDMVQALKSRASLCAEAGMDGLVCSPTDLPLIAPGLGGSLKLVVPGIRDGDNLDDQRRTASIEEALHMGADYLVIGRPILKAVSPGEALKDIITRMEGLDEKSDFGRKQ
ncbi:MAG: orotidine-5'-phosphate decarboxylase [Thermovirga sp.]